MAKEFLVLFLFPLFVFYAARPVITGEGHHSGVRCAEARQKRGTDVFRTLKR